MQWILCLQNICKTRLHSLTERIQMRSNSSKNNSNEFACCALESYRSACLIVLSGTWDPLHSGASWTLSSLLTLLLRRCVQYTTHCCYHCFSRRSCYQIISYRNISCWIYNWILWLYCLYFRRFCLFCFYVNIHRESKKQRHQTLVHVFAKCWPFSKFFHCYTQQEIHNKTMITDHTPL